MVTICLWISLIGTDSEKIMDSNVIYDNYIDIYIIIIMINDNKNVMENEKQMFYIHVYS